MTTIDRDSYAGAMSQQEIFNRDAARFDEAFRKAGAIVTEPDGFRWIDTTKVCADLVRAYQGFISYGYANGLMP